MTIAAVNPIDGFTAAPSTTGAASVTYSAGDNVLVFVGGDDFGTLTSITSLTDNKGGGSHTYTKLGSISGSYEVSVFYSPGVTAGSYTLTANGNGISIVGIALAVVRITGGNTSAAAQLLTGNNQDPGNTSTDGIATGSVAPAGQPAMLIALTFQDQAGFAAGAGTGMTLLAQPTGFSNNFGDANIGYKRVTSTSSAAATFTGVNTNRQLTIGAIILEASGGAANPYRIQYIAG
jgi:hypothetical protein